MIIQEESGITHVADPWAGSYMMENLTEEVYSKAMEIIEEVEELGGMTKAIESGMPKYRIEESALKRQAKIDSGLETIVGVNKYKVNVEDEAKVEVLKIDNSVVREKQIERIEAMKAARDEAVAQKCLADISEAAKTGNGNLLGLSVEAAKARCTLGEISSAMEDHFGRYKPKANIVRGAYQAVATGIAGEAAKNEFEATVGRVKEFAKIEGRNPRILVAKMGQDGHDRGAKVVASGFADVGFDVDVGTLFQTPEEVARQCIDNDVHVVGVSSLAAGHNTLVPQLKGELAKLGGEDIVVVVGGVIPREDYPFLFENGADHIFGPGTRITDCADKILEGLIEEASQ